MHCVYCKRLNDESAKKCGHCGAELFPVAQVDDLQFDFIESTMAKEFKSQKVGLFSKGNLNKIVSSIEKGTCGTVKVRVEACKKQTEHYDDATLGEDYSVYNLQTLEKHPIADSVEAIKNFNPADMSEAYLFRIKIGKTNKLLLVESNETTYLLNNIKDLIYVVDARILQLRNRDILDAAINNVADFVSGLFSKK